MFGLRKKDVVFPDTSWLQQAEQELVYTPDIADLERKLRHAVFFCDGHMRKRYQHGVIEQFPYLGTVFTRERFFHWKRNLGFKSFTIPIIAPQGAKSLATGSIRSVLPQPARIKGELYLIDTPYIKNLDRFMENGVKYTRRRLSFMMPVKVTEFVKDRALLENYLGEPLQNASVYTNEVHRVSAWMYQAVETFWEDQLDGGYSYSPVRTFKPAKSSLGEYSFFSNLEYDTHTQDEKQNSRTTHIV